MDKTFLALFKAHVKEQFGYDIHPMVSKGSDLYSAVFGDMDIFPKDHDIKVEYKNTFANPPIYRGSDNYFVKCPIDSTTGVAA